MRGPNGYEETNNAGKELLDFLSSNEATLCNTWFQKRANRKQTWQNPKSKQWHCIDYTIMRQQHHKMCLNVTVMREAECNTDHHMLRMKLLVRHRRMICRRVKTGKNAKRFDVNMLQGRSEDDKGRETTRGVFQRKVSDRARELWREKGRVEDKWGAVKAALCETAEVVVGFEVRKQPDWFHESEAAIKPSLEERNKLYSLWQSTGQERDRKKIALSCTQVGHEIKEAKNWWFQMKVSEAQRSRFGGKVVWRCSRDIRRGRRGLVPVRMVTVMDEEENACNTPEQQ